MSIQYPHPTTFSYQKNSIKNTFHFSISLSRTLFCEKFIVPRTIVAGKYISLYRKIRDNGHYIHTSSSKTNGKIAGKNSNNISGCNNGICKISTN